MGCHDFFSIENGKKDFIEMVKIKALYNEKRKEIADAVQAAKLEIKKADGLISQTVNELAAAFFMRPSKKRKKYAYIESLKNDKASGQEKIVVLDEELKELNLQTFGSENVPKLYFGKYVMSAGGPKEPLEWDVMRVSGERALLMSVKIIDQIQYARELENTSWKESNIRAWTNGEFYENSFSEDERSMILETEIANPGNNTYKTASSSNTRDYIFIPSMNDARRFYKYDSERMAFATEYAAGRGVYVNEDTKGSYWWLRSNGGNMYNAAVVNFEGYVFEYGFYVNSTQFGVRPAMWIDLK